MTNQLQTSYCTFILCLSSVLLGACSPKPSVVAEAYKNELGKVNTSFFTACPPIEGVWRLSELTGGSLRESDNELTWHLRWAGPKIFDLSVNSRSFIAIEPRLIETAIFIAYDDKLPPKRNNLGYTIKTQKELSCLGDGWSQVAQTSHSENQAAARVLGLLPEKPRMITQTDYIAQGKEAELILGTHIEFEGTNEENKPSKSDYWKFVKMPRLHESPKAQGFKE